jgi:uncharacterized YigZ family protein
MVVRRSRFIATAEHAPDVEAARALVERVREEMPDATHHCWAFVAGPPGDTARIGMSDDGEPHGTAGRPMLTVLLNGGVGEIAVVCTRYFGGVKLGTGGLSRAYAEATKLVLDSLPRSRRVHRVSVSVRIGYGEVDGLRRVAAELGAAVEGEEFAEDVRVRLGVPASELDSFEAALADLSQGRARIDRG